jgi:acetyl esterase/lipase
MVPQDPSDLVITIEAEDRHHFKVRLSEIAAPTLVIAGAKDPLYSATLFRETAEGIPHARLILYPGMGHPASGKQFRQDVLAFLKGEVSNLQAGRETALRVKKSSLEAQRGVFDSADGRQTR